MVYFTRVYVRLLCDDLWKSQDRHRFFTWAGAVGPTSPFGPNRVNKMIATKRYREHNVYVKATCPADKLLVYNPKDGWPKLCAFLGLKVPDMEFPNKNKGGQIVEDILFRHPRALKQRYTVIKNLLISIAVVAAMVYYVVQNFEVVKR